MTKPSNQFRKSWRDYLVVGGIATAAVSGLIIYTFSESNVSKVISIAADDISLSAKDAGFSSVWNEHCQVRAERYVSGDKLISYFFADQPEKVDERLISTGLDTLAACPQVNTQNMEIKINRQITKLEIGRKDGTCLICLLEAIQSEIRRRREQGDERAVIVTITLQAAEPGVEQPSVDFDRIKELINSIVRDKGVVAVIGTKGWLHSQLEASAGDRVSICFVQNMTSCVKEAFDTARKL